MSEHTKAEELKQKLHSETAKIAWHELQRFFAGGSVLWVSSTLDLVETAALFANDDSLALQALVEQGLVTAPSNSQATRWYDCKAYLWSVVVAPFVLVQELSAEEIR